MSDLNETTIPLSDTELVERIVSSNDTRYFSVLYDRYASFVYNKCYSFVSSQAEAEDLTHDIFIKIYVHLKSFKGDSKLSTWIYAITYHFCINYINKKKKWVVSDTLDVWAMDEEQPVEDHLYEEELFEMNYNRLQEILDQIPVDDKMILLMKYQDDLSIKEIANVLNVKLSTVKMRLHRAKKKVIELRDEHGKSF